LDLVFLKEKPTSFWFCSAIGIYSLKNIFWQCFRMVNPNMNQTSATTILNLLQNTLDLPKLVKTNNDPYKTLVQTIISQNTADTNTERAFEKLSQRFEISPQTLADAQTNSIEECIQIAGLSKNKTKTIQTASKIIITKFQGSLKPILSLPLDEARNALMELPGVGPKTADVVLLFSANKPTIPVDTHVNRVSKRLGLAPVDGDYEEVRACLQAMFEPKDYLVVHLLLIALGRKYCRARRPFCPKCQVNFVCSKNSLGGKK
jgi:endonuclease III